MILHFEGLDLAGKSTVCRLLKDALPNSWRIRRNTLLESNPVESLADKLRKEEEDPVCVGWLYHAALRYDLAHFRESGDSIVQDSTILLRSLAYHSAFGNAELVECFLNLLEDHPRFDRSFVLVPDRETRLHRLRIRRKQNLGPEDFLVVQNPEVFQKMEEILVEYSCEFFRATVVDTSGSIDMAWIDNFIRNHLRDIV